MISTLINLIQSIIQLFQRSKQLPRPLLYCGDSCKRSFTQWLSKEPRASNFAILSSQQGRCSFCSELVKPKKRINII